MHNGTSIQTMKTWKKYGSSKIYKTRYNQSYNFSYFEISASLFQEPPSNNRRIFKASKLNIRGNTEEMKTSTEKCSAKKIL